MPCHGPMRVDIATQALLISTCPRFMVVLVQHNRTNRHRLPVVDVRNNLAQKQYSANRLASYKRVIRITASKNYEVSKINVTFWYRWGERCLYGHIHLQLYVRPYHRENRNVASKYIINIGSVNKLGLQGLNMNIYWHSASEISCCLEYNKLESVFSARAMLHGLLHTYQTQCVGGDWGGLLQKTRMFPKEYRYLWRPITSISTYKHQLLLLGWPINRHCPDNFQYDYINTILL